MNEKSRKVSIKKFITIFISLLAIVITVLICSYFIFFELESQLQHNLADVGKQNALALKNKIHSNHVLLEGLSENMHQQTPETIDETLQSFTIFLESYDLKRFAFCFSDGTSYATDGGVADLSYREFFMRGMEGKGSISGVLNDALDESHSLVNVMTIPVFDDQGNVEGVFGLTYDSQVFNESLQIECLDGHGYSCAFNNDGEIMVAMGNDILHLSENIFSDVLGQDSRNEHAVEALKQKMSENQSHGGNVYLDDETYYYCTPVSLMDGDVTWYVLTLIPVKYLNTRVSPVQNSLYSMAFAVAILISIGSAFIILLSRDQKSMLLRYAYEDPLTKGPNLAKFTVELKKKHSLQGYIVSMDITHFNNINIAAGKAAGDIMIHDIWQILFSEIREGEFAAHTQEDRFILFIYPEDKASLVEKLVRISNRISDHAKELQIKGIHARYGIYLMQGQEELEDAISKARLAREQLKTQQKKCYIFYDEMNFEKLQQDQQLEDRFDEALAEGEFEVWYQPKYSVSTSMVVGSEALVRWRDKDGSLISPGRFIPLFEQNGMITKLDEHMFRSVCKQQVEWQKQGYKIYPVSINLSRTSLYYSDIADKYLAIMKDYGIDPENIQLEITETALQGTSDIRGLLEKFRSTGIRILMDDFGTGYSSLSTLNMRCFDTLKLDKSLIDHIGDQNGETLLYYVINMGQHLGLHITAEGVETYMQFDFLKENHCDDIQGFLFSKPLPADSFAEMLAE